MTHEQNRLTSIAGYDELYRIGSAMLKRKRRMLEVIDLDASFGLVRFHGLSDEVGPYHNGPLIDPGRHAFLTGCRTTVFIFAGATLFGSERYSS